MKLLLVDDHAVVREGVRRLLSMAVEATVFEAKTGREALAVFKAEKPEVVILDLNLPGSGGLDLLRRLLIEDAKTKVLIFSMHTTPLYVARALQAGAKGYVSKGAGGEELVEAVKVVIAGGRYVERDLASDLAVNVLGTDDPGEPAPRCEGPVGRQAEARENEYVEW